MNRLQFFKSCGAALAAALTPVPSFAKEEEGEEKELKLSDCPEKVRKTIRDFARDGKIMEVKKERKGDKWVYEAGFVHNSQKLEIQVAENGKLIKIEPDEEDEKEEKGKKREKDEKGEKREDRKEKEEDDEEDENKKGKKREHKKEKEDDDNDDDQKGEKHDKKGEKKEKHKEGDNANDKE